MNSLTYGARKSTTTKNQLIDTGNILVVANMGGWGEMDKGGQKVHTSSYKINQSWDVMAITIVNNTMLCS